MHDDLTKIIVESFSLYFYHNVNNVVLDMIILSGYAGAEEVLQPGCC